MSSLQTPTSISAPGISDAEWRDPWSSLIGTRALGRIMRSPPRHNPTHHNPNQFSIFVARRTDQPGLPSFHVVFFCPVSS